MNRSISPKIIALTFGVLVISFLAAFYVIAWQEPTQAPPQGNVPAPLNVGPDGQSKAGGLILNTGGGANALIIDKGKICIGTDCRDKWPETGFITTYRLEATGYRVGDKYYGDSSSFTCPEDSNVVNIYLSKNDVRIQGAQGGACIWGCQAGQCSYSYQNSCSYSISGSTATLRAHIVESYEPDCACCTGYSLVDYCYPHTGSGGWPKWSCSIPGGSLQCVMEFQCGKKEKVGE